MRKILVSALLLVSTVLAWCFWMSSEKDGPLETGDYAYITYTGSYVDDGTMFDWAWSPTKIKIGDATFSAAFDQALLGMMKGETKTFTLIPQDLFGSQYDKNMIRVLPAQYFTVGGRTVEKWSMINIDGRDGTVISISWEGDKQVLTIDLNPKYTWTDISYTVTIHQIGWNDFNPANI